MSNCAFWQLYYHVVWTTKCRSPSIPRQLRAWVEDFISTDASKRGAEVLACGAMADHVHVLVALPPTVALASFVGQVKGAASYAFNHLEDNDTRLEWQEGYGLISLRRADTESVIRYINNQDRIHSGRVRAGLLERVSSSPDQPAFS
jgi:putative transposase